MISRVEFHAALTLALAAATAPIGRKELPCASEMPSTNGVCFDFWRDNSMRIVGTNTRRLAATFLTVAGAPHCAKILVTHDQAREMLRVFDYRGLPITIEPPPRITLVQFGLHGLLLTSGSDTLLVQGTGAPLYPEYSYIVSGEADTTKDATFSADTLRWVLDQLAPLSADPAEVSVHVRLHGPTLFRPVIREDFPQVERVVLALKPAVTW